MDAFRLLLQRAAAKRDDAIASARSTYRKEAKLVEELRTSLGDTGPERASRKGRKSVISLVAQVMPQDHTFTIQDVLGLLQKAEPERAFNLASLRSDFSKMVDRGMVRRVRRLSGGQLLWAAPDCEVDDVAIAALPLPGAISEILGERGPLAVAEIVVALKEAGYRPEADPRILLQSVRDVFKRNRGRFVRGESGRWAVHSSASTSRPVQLGA